MLQQQQDPKSLGSFSTPASGDASDTQALNNFIMALTTNMPTGAGSPDDIKGGHTQLQGLEQL